MLLIDVAVVPAQQSDIERWFDGVERGTETPEVAHAPPPERRLRLPGYYGGGLRFAQSRGGAAAAQNETEALPMPPAGSSSTSRVEGNLPMAGWDADVDIAQGTDGRIDRLVVRDASLSKVLALLAQTYHLNIVASNDIDAVISITLRDVALEEALTAILSVANYTWVNRDGIILITSLSDTAQLSPEVQGRVTQIFELDFVSASIISEAVTNFLSPIGKMTVVESDPTDNLRTRNMIVVEDVPEAIARIADYIAQADCPPRQVLIEAHILQVTLKDDQKNGVNFNALLRAAGSDIHLKTVGFANPAAAPAFLSTVEGGDLTSVIELIQTTNDTKTLGSPKVLVLNQQEATVHVGEDLGYQTTVTSELQSTQAPQFLQVGVLLTITPRITRDNRVLLHVRPEVSTGVIDPITQVPNKKTTELETDVMLHDGEGMVIGGLIDEQDSTQQSKIPYLGDLWRVGFLFRKSGVIKERKEVIIALVPRIQPYNAEYHDFDQGELIRAQTPLYQGPLCYTDRPFEAHLPDGKRVARPYIPPGAHLPQVDRQPCNYCEAPWPQYYMPPKPYPRERLAEGPDGEFVGDEFAGDGDGCIDSGLSQPDAGLQPQPEMAGEFVPGDDSGYGDSGYGDSQYGGGYEGGSIISDQP
jgi:hypothetical protein